MREWTIYGGSDEWARQAERSLEEILADAGMRELHPAAGRLLAFVTARLHPERRRSELAARLSGPLDGPVRQDLIDYFWLLERTEAGAADDGMTEWLRAFREDPATASRSAVERWRERRSVPWLVLALRTLGPESGADAEELFREAARFDASHPAFWTLAYHRARILTELRSASSTPCVITGGAAGSPRTARTIRSSKSS